MRSKSIACAMMALLLAIPVAAQSTAELLQRGIFAQETEGNLDNAIAIYRQVVQSSSPQRDLVAQAQLRLGQALLQKGSLDLAAAEFQRLARDFGDQQETISRMASQARVTHDMAEFDARMITLRKLAVETHSAAALASIGASTFDTGKPVAIQGIVSQVVFMNPTGVVAVDSNQNGDKYVFATAAANALIRQGMARASLKAGQQVTVTGVLADDGRRLPTGEFIAKASTIAAQDGTIVWDRSRPLASPQETMQDEQKQALQQLLKAIEAQKAQAAQAK